MVKDDKLPQDKRFVFDEREIPIDINSEGFRLMTRIQDEVHRFAIEYHRSLRSKEQVRSILDDIDGIGEKRRKGSHETFCLYGCNKNASVNELAAVDGMKRKAAENVYKFFS